MLRETPCCGKDPSVTRHSLIPWYIYLTCPLCGREARRPEHILLGDAFRASGHLPFSSAMVELLPQATATSDLASAMTGARTVSVSGCMCPRAVLPAV
jgi:hypothetical protein